MNYRATIIQWTSASTLVSRGLDVADAGLVLGTELVTREDARFEYGEDRFITVGYLAGRCVVLVWTPRGEARRIISMRYVSDKEERRWRAAAGR